MLVMIETPVAVSVGSVCERAPPVKGRPPITFWMSPRRKPSAWRLALAA
jgi:hypothetical protein